jgi:hypothetical protein
LDIIFTTGGTSVTILSSFLCIDEKGEQRILVVVVIDPLLSDGSDQKFVVDMEWIGTNRNEAIDTIPI